MDITQIRKEVRRECNESFLTLLSGLRKNGIDLTPEERAYNNALADAYDFILEKDKTCLYPHTLWCGKWVRN